MTFTTDKRAGMVSRFLSVLFGTLLGMLDKKQETLRQQVEALLVKTPGVGSLLGASTVDSRERWY